MQSVIIETILFWSCRLNSRSHCRESRGLGVGVFLRRIRARLGCRRDHKFFSSGMAYSVLSHPIHKIPLSGRADDSSPFFCLCSDYKPWVQCLRILCWKNPSGSSLKGIGFPVGTRASASGRDLKPGRRVFPRGLKPIGQSLPENKPFGLQAFGEAGEPRTATLQENVTFPVGQKFQLEDVIEAQQFNREILSAIFEVAQRMEKVEKNSIGGNILRGYLMATLFYEPSTRTRLSFESAMKRLGGEVLTTENAREFSSAAKGETLEDTIRTVEGYSDIIVLRHFESGAARQAAAVANIPLINAGDGPGQHPTQALLDVYTIQREIGRLDNIKVGLVGDLANGRTVRSLAYLLAKYRDVKFYFVAPDVVNMKDDIKEYLTSKGVEWVESSDLMEVASNCDVVYQTRIQRERFGEKIDLYNEARGKYIVDKKVMNVLQKHAVVMHPLPRLDEITLDVDLDPRAAYFRQAKNGLYIRMALLKLLLLGW